MAVKSWKIAALTASSLLALSACVPLAPPRDAAADRLPAASSELLFANCGDIECGNVFVPLDWDHPDGEQIQLRLARLASYSAQPLGTVFINPGGPGASGVEYLSSAAGELDAIRNHYHVVSWDPRGVDHSTAIRCLTAAELDEEIYGYDAAAPEPGSAAWLADTKTSNEELAEQCRANSGRLLEHVSTAATVRDLEQLRQLAGDTQLNYLGFSYGTYIGARYADAYPETVGRMVLDGALDPQVDTQEVVLAQTKGFELALHNYLTDCVAHGCWFAGDVAAGKEQVRQLLERVDKEPLRAADGRYVTSSVLLTAIITPLYSQSSWDFLTKLFQEVQQGETATALLLADFYNDRNPDGSYANNSREAFNAINCADYPQRTPDLTQMQQNAQELKQQAPLFGPYQGYSEASCWGWPVQAAERTAVTANGAAPIIVVGTKGDPATPHHWAVNLAEQLASGVLVSYEGEGHIAFGTSHCVSTLVADYFNNGVVPQNNTVCAVTPKDLTK